MWFIFKRLFLGLFLIVLAASVLLLSDLRSRRRAGAAPTAQKIFKVAVLQHSSQTILDQGVKGMLDGLVEKGFAEGRNMELRRFNAEGDMPTANTIAHSMTDGSFDLILTATTPSLQAVASANKEGKTKHIFALVTDPYGAGVGISRTNHLSHPAWLAGFGTMQPVEESFKIAREMRPALKSVGVVWNAAEANSLVTVTLARAVCHDLKIELLEASVENSSGVFEAANSLVARGVEALWIGGDTTVLAAANSMVQAARKGGIPVFTVIPPNAEKGALFDLGANYYEVGKLAGDLAGDVLSGRDPATVAIENVIPRLLVINRLALRDLRDEWKISGELLAKADVVIDESGKHQKAAPLPVQPIADPLARKWKLVQISYSDSPIVEEAQHGVTLGLKESGLVEGRDYEIKYFNAQGDMATLSGIMDAAAADGDLLLVATTPGLQAAMKRAKNIPVVFFLVANPVIAGAGTTDQDHLPNITGSYCVSPFEEMVAMLKQCVPGVKRIGTLFVPTEVNSVFYKDRLTGIAQAAGIEVQTVGVSTSGEVPDGALALCNQNIDILCQISDNLSGASFASILQAAKRGRIPLFGFSSRQAQLGAVLCAARDYVDNGRLAALMAARVMRGENPAAIPFQKMEGVKLYINLQAAGEGHINIPDPLIKKADLVIGTDGKVIQPTAKTPVAEPKPGGA